GWCPLSPTGAQTTQLLVEPPWRPAVLWDRVTLTCQGSGTAGATTWYKDGQRLASQDGGNPVLELGTPGELGVTQWGDPGAFGCDRTPLSPDWLVLQVPARVLLEGDTVTLRCQG
ncbi:FCGR3 protein, partial [Pheucticus melanocephalus]|nr:FCGR3 protein [Pheucticus melanocephalus]